VDVVGERGDVDPERRGRDPGEGLIEASDAHPVEVCLAPLVVEGLGEALGGVVVEEEAEGTDGLAGRLGGRQLGGRRVEAVDDEGVAGHPLFFEALAEEEDLLDGHGRGAGDQHVGDVGGAEGAGDLLGALLEAAEEVVELGDKLGDLLEEVAPGELADALEDHRGALGEDVEAELAGLLKGVDEPAHGGAVEGVHEALGGVEEVEGVGGGGGIEEDQVEGVVGLDRVELLHGHVLVGTGEGGGDVLIEPVVEDAVPRLGGGGVAVDQLVEGALGVEHHDREGAVDLEPRVEEALGVDGLGLGGHGAEAQAVGEAPGGVDGEAEHPLAPARGGEAEGGGGGGLADTPGADHEDHTARGEQSFQGQGQLAVAPPAGGVQDRKVVSRGQNAEKFARWLTPKRTEGSVAATIRSPPCTTSSPTPATAEVLTRWCWWIRRARWWPVPAPGPCARSLRPSRPSSRTRSPAPRAGRPSSTSCGPRCSSSSSVSRAPRCCSRPGG
jgi:hypothetical protein